MKRIHDYVFSWLRRDENTEMKNDFQTSEVGVKKWTLKMKIKCEHKRQQKLLFSAYTKSDKLLYRETSKHYLHMQTTRTTQRYPRWMTLDTQTPHTTTQWHVYTLYTHTRHMIYSSATHTITHVKEDEEQNTRTYTRETHENTQFRPESKGHIKEKVQVFTFAPYIKMKSWSKTYSYQNRP